jgi:hypothetical protein
MPRTKDQERTARAAVARYFAAHAQAGGDPTDIAVARLSATNAAAVPRLRFDRVALRVIECMRAALRESAPSGTTGILTITAPIRVPAKTVAALDERMRSALDDKARSATLVETISGNAVRLRILKRSAPHTPRLVGFVHNPDPRADVLLDATQSLLTAIDAMTGKRPAKNARSALVLAGAASDADVEIYRQACAQLTDIGYAKIVIVREDGRVEELIG